MLSWPKYDLTRQPRAEVLALLEQLIGLPEISSVHYLGYAHEAVLRLLHRRFGASFSVMDLPDRYHTGVAFFWEGEGDYPGPRRPEWLNGVLFSQEGWPPYVDLLICDAPFSAPDQLSRMLSRRRQGPKFIVLADEACAAASHPAYSWTLYSDHNALGMLKEKAHEN